MGRYFDPGNAGFERIIKGRYVDKTALIANINGRLGTADNLLCISRPRRFGKSYAAQMICAYYDCSCDSHELFGRYRISETADYEAHINKYHVIYLDIAGVLSELMRSGLPISAAPKRIMEDVRLDIINAYPELAESGDVSDCILACAELTGRRFVFIIDEWDAIIREAKGDGNTVTAYLNLLRSWFKNGNFTPRTVAAAYMTGILPIKKDGSQSAISDFHEYSFLYPDGLAEYTGFTETEVQRLCAERELCFDEFRRWYDGYSFDRCGSVYNPYSVMMAIRDGRCRSYWQRTSAAESLFTYINMDFDGLREAILRLLAGEEVEVSVDSFENDFVTFKSRHDVLTLLIHLGYLAYDENRGSVCIPNAEVAGEFRQILTGASVSPKWLELIRRSKELLYATIAGDEAAVSARISQIRDSEYAPAYYNDEQALRYVIKFAYVYALEDYLKVEELPTGRGIADVVYIPKPRSPLPALIIELKWNKTADGAVEQIKRKHYPAVLSDYSGEILLVGINYDAVTKTHSCRIVGSC